MRTGGLDVFGARRAGVDASDAATAASAASLGDVQVQVAAEVALNYILLRTAQARWRIANGNLDSLQETLQIARWRLQAGLVSALDAEQARAAVAQNRAQLPLLQTSILQSGNALALLTAARGSTASAKQVWVLPAGGAGAPMAVSVVPGISDGRMTEITGGDLKAGMQVITGQKSAAT